MLTEHQIKRLARFEANPCVSIYLPTHRRWRETRQDAVRLKNLLRQAEERLRAEGMRQRDVDTLLEGARALIADQDFWRYQRDGLAVFIAPGHTIHLSLPLAAPEEVHVGVRFNIKHLLPVVAKNERFHVLAIAQDYVRLYAGTRYALEAVAADDIPQSIAIERDRTDYQEKVGFHPTGPTPTTHGKPWAKTHAGGEAPQDVREIEMKDWLRKVAAAVEKRFADETQPLVVVADDRLLGHFKGFFRYPDLLETSVRQHPDAFSVDQLHERAWAIVEPVVAERIREAKEHYAALAGEGNERAPHDLSAIIGAAKDGRVDVLFVAEDRQVLGHVSPDGGAGGILAEPGDGDEDLLDRAAAEALATGAAVYALPESEMPGGYAAAAILRY